MPRPGPRPEVGFDAGLAESVTHVRLEDFDGPLALLLAVIEARQLDVLTVPLGGLAEAYLDALATLEGDRLGNVSAFVAVAAQLILIKSRAILPRPPKMSAIPLDDEPDPEAELRARLLEYRRFRDAGAALGERLDIWRLFRRDAEVAASAGGRREAAGAAAAAAERSGRALARLATVVPVVAAPATRWWPGRSLWRSGRPSSERRLRGSDMSSCRISWAACTTEWSSRSPSWRCWSCPSGAR
jgi:hypothetical protein